MTVPEVLRAARDTLDQALTLDWPQLALSEDARLLLLGQVWAESRFGSTSDWGTSNNWGAVTYHKGDGKFIEHADHDANGKPVVYRFQAYDTQLDAARDWLRVIMRGSVPAVISMANAYELAAAMKANRYYTGVSGTEEDRIKAYTSFLTSSAEFVRSRLAGARVQECLQAAGYDPGPVDGVIGPRTIAAVRAFQGDHGIRVSGIVDAETRLALEDSTPTDPEIVPCPSEPPPVPPEAA